jgi:hypothetical protein
MNIQMVKDKDTTEPFPPYTDFDSIPLFQENEVKINGKTRFQTFNIYVYICIHM